MIYGNVDFLIVGIGIYGATIARLLTDVGYKCFMIDKRNRIGGNIYTENTNYGYHVHKYGAHIFHTNDDSVIKFVNKYANWNQYCHNVIATDGEKIYHLPFNMNTYYDIFGVTNPESAKHIIENEINTYISSKKDNSINNLEEYAKSSVGITIYEKLIKNYTEKQWNKKCSQLDPNIIKRLPLRYSFDNNYFEDKFQGIPEDGYTKFIENIIYNIPYILNTKFNYEYWKDKVKHIIYCGAVDELFDYELGNLEWRSLIFENSYYIYNGFNGQGTSVINLVGKQKGTRIIEHMWFTPKCVHPDIKSIITREIPCDWSIGKEKFYAVNNEHSNKLYNEYKKLLNKKMPNVILGGRLGKYKYFDMDDSIIEAMNDYKIIYEKYI